MLSGDILRKLDLCGTDPEVKASSMRSDSAILGCRVPS